MIRQISQAARLPIEFVCRVPPIVLEFRLKSQTESVRKDDFKSQKAKEHPEMAAPIACPMSHCLI